MPKTDKENKKIKKLKRRLIFTDLIGIIVFAFLCIYVPVVIIISSTTKPNIELITNGQIKDSFQASGVIFKEETLFVAEFDGSFAKGAVEGERIPSGYLIASVINNDYVTMFDEYCKICEDIIKRKEDSGVNSGIFTSDLKSLEDSIQNAVKSVVLSTNNGNLANTQKYYSDIKRLSEYRNEIVLGLNSDNLYIQELEEKSSQLKKSFEGQISDIYSANSGYITYMIDGYEEDYVLDQTFSYTVEELNKLLDKSIELNPYENDIIKDEPFAKLINGQVYYIAILVENDKIEDLEDSSNIKLDIEDPNIEVSVSNVIYGVDNGKKTCVYFEIDSKLNELSSYRKINAEIILKEYYGLKVRKSSLVNLDSFPFKEIQIAAVKENYVEFLDVEVVADDGTFAIITTKDHTISLYDYYVVKPSKVEEGEIVK